MPPVCSFAQAAAGHFDWRLHGTMDRTCTIDKIKLAEHESMCKLQPEGHSEYQAVQSFMMSLRVWEWQGPLNTYPQGTQDTGKGCCALRVYRSKHPKP